MLLPLTGFRDARLRRAYGSSRVFDAVRHLDDRATTIKLYELGPELESRVEHEFAALMGLELPGVARALGFQRVGDELVLLYEGLSGVSVTGVTRGEPLELSRFGRWAIQLTELVAQIHGAGFVHRDIKPSSVFVEAETDTIRLAELGVSVLLDRERRHVYDPTIVAHTLPYIAPEQTGRTGRGVDGRSDLYSLGAVFYELLTGRPPFEQRDPLELIHAQLARAPVELRLHRPELPEVLARLVMRLLAKAPEHRYQTAAGLLADLRALAAFGPANEWPAEFELGLADHPRELRFPHQLYGRGRERQVLVDVFEDVIERGQASLVLLSGSVGTGKSALIAELTSEVVRVGSYVGRGRFERRGDRPYSAYSSAFGGVVDQLLTEPEVRLARWRERLGEALGGIARAVIEMVPDLGLILGELPELVTLEPNEARNRIQLAVARFLSVFGEAQRPFVLVLEDLQWADASSLALLESLLLGRGNSALLVVGSVRESELGAEHPLRDLLARVPDRVRRCELGPLSLTDVEALLADALGRAPAEVRSLAKLIGRKTDNNPLLVRQHLAHLAERGLLVAGPGGFDWDDAAIEAEAVPANLAAVLRSKLAALGPAGVELLACAACIGERFDLGTLKAVVRGEDAELTARLYSLVDAGLLDHVVGEYRFSHPDLREAARLRLSAAQRSELHWSIGLHWLTQLAGAGSVRGGDRLFEIVDQLGAGVAAAGAELAESTRTEIAELSLLAGRRALDSAAHESALRYLDQGHGLVEEFEAAVAEQGRAARHYSLIVDLRMARAQALGARGELERAEEEFETLARWPLRPHEQARVAASRVAQLNLAGRNHEAVQHGLAVLDAHGCEIEANPDAAEVRVELERVWSRVAELTPAQLESAPLCVDEHAAAVMAMLTPIKNAAYIVEPNLYVLLVSAHVRWVLDHGLYPAASLALAQLAICVGSMLGRVPGAVQLCARARAVAARLDGSPTQIRVDAATLLFVEHLGRPFAEPLARMDQVYARTLEVGDSLWAGYTGAVALGMHLEVGTHLEVLARQCERFERDLGRRASAEASVVAQSLRAVSVMLGPSSEDPEQLADASTTLDPVRVAASGASPYAVHVTVANRALVQLLLRRDGDALELCLGIAETVERVLFASWIVPRVALTLLVAATRLELDGRAPPPDWVEIRARAWGQIERWWSSAPANYAHYRDLVAGLERRLAGELFEAQGLFEQARTHAATQGCRWVEGLAAEELAALAAAAKLPGYARGAQLQASAAYAAWGAEAKLAQLRGRPGAEPDLDVRGGHDAKAHDSRRSEDSRRARVGSIDFDSVLRSVAAIAADLRVDQVVAAVLDAALGNAGADRGLLVLERGGHFEVVATAAVEGGPEVLSEPRSLAEVRADTPTSVIRYVLRTGHAVVLDDAGADPRFADDLYLRGVPGLSLLCMPLGQARGNGSAIEGVLVLENRLSRRSFTPARLEVLQLIAGQATTALRHARVHAALREGEARWRSLVDGVPDVIALLDGQGTVEFVNRGVHRGVGDSDEYRLFERIAASAAAPSWRRAVAAVLERGEAQELELELPDPKGSSRWYVVRLNAIESGQPRRALAIATDVSERMLAEVHKRELEAQLRQQQRLESIGTLASGVAHEINNPVQGIMNYADLIASNTGDEQLVREFAGEIAHESERVADIVRNLLAFSRHESVQAPIEVVVREMVGATLSLIRTLVHKDQITLDVDIPDDLPAAVCRPQQIQQIVMNLVTNARDALNTVYPGYDERKRITIQAEPRVGADGQRWVRIVVADTGPGIPPEVMARIFDPFFTTKGRDQGTGLGLAVSHGIARDHGGDLVVESELGQGARFLLDLPAGAIL